MTISRKILLSILLAGAILVVVIFAIYKYLNLTPLNNQDVSPSPSPVTGARDPGGDITQPPDMRIYEDKINGYQFAYSAKMKVGVVAPNSSLGTYDQPVAGIYVGQYVFVPARTVALRKTAGDFINSFYKDAFNSEAEAHAFMNKEIERPGGAACYKVVIPNENKLQIKAVECYGDGGPAFYALVLGNTLDLFVDGYSRGFSELAEQQGKIEFGDLQSILSTVRFF